MGSSAARAGTVTKRVAATARSLRMENLRFVAADYIDVQPDIEGQFMGR
jgi:hypothetical protein